MLRRVRRIAGDVGMLMSDANVNKSTKQHCEKNCGNVKVVQGSAHKQKR